MQFRVKSEYRLSMQLLRKKLLCCDLFIRNSKLMHYVMAVRQKMINDYISPEMGNCGMMWKMEPSIVYPTSHVSNQKSRSERKK